MAPRLVLVVNAHASGVRDPAHARDEWAALLERAGGSVEAHVTETIDELAALCAAAAGRRVVLAGGDGSVHSVANLPGEPPEVALLPAGGANNIAESLGIPTEPAAAAEIAVRGRVRRIDVIEARNGERRHVAVEGASVGAHAVARRRYRARTSSDVAAAVRAAWSGLRRFHGASIVLEADDVVHGERIAQVFVANLPRFGFGLHVAPNAKPDDGLLDVVVHGWSGRVALVPLFARLRLARLEASAFTAERVRIDTGRSPLVCDTEDLGRGLVELAVIPRALPLIAP